MKKDMQLKELLRKYREGSASLEEQAVLEQWYNAHALEPENIISETELLQARHQIWSGANEQAGLGRKFLPDIEQTIKNPISNQQIGVFRVWRSIVVAASIVLVAALGLYIHSTFFNEQDFDTLARKNKIVPGDNRAILTLSDGTRIDLNNAKVGSLAQQGGIRIRKTDDGRLIYNFTDKNLGLSGFNTVSTPNGGQHQISLPDGSRVWLNASSSLRFPISFASMRERKVELLGEAYFEIMKDKNHPFLVSSPGQLVQVMGTHFNVNAYNGAGAIKTTLLEGRVRIKANGVSVDLSPGQQASLSKSGGLKVREVMADQSIAWKNGYFMFDDDELEVIMANVGRWYDVEVVFEDQELKRSTFWGPVNRFKSIGEVLRVMERTGKVHFRIEGKRIYVSR